MGTSYAYSQIFGAVRNKSSEVSAFGGFFYPTFFANHPFCGKQHLRPCIAFLQHARESDQRTCKVGIFIFLDVEVLDFEGVVSDEVSSFFDIAAH